MKFPFYARKRLHLEEKRKTPKAVIKKETGREERYGKFSNRIDGRAEL